MENGNVTAYALEGVQDRGLFFAEPGDPKFYMTSEWCKQPK